MFVYETPTTLVKEIMQDSLLVTRDSWLQNFNPMFSKFGEKLIGELNTGSWWEFAEDKARVQYGEDINIVPFIISSDKTNVGKKRSVWPMYLTIGNLRIRDRNKLSGKRLLGFLPKIENRHLKNAKDVSAFSLGVFNTCYKLIFQELRENRLFKLRLPFENHERRFVLIPMMLPADHEERCKHVCIRQGQTNRPCPHCLVTKMELEAKVMNSTSNPRRLDDMTALISRNDKHETKMFSLHPVLPAAAVWFEEYNPMGYYYCSPSCFLHVVQAVTKYTISNTVDAVKHYGIKEKPKKSKKSNNRYRDNLPPSYSDDSDDDSDDHDDESESDGEAEIQVPTYKSLEKPVLNPVLGRFPNLVRMDLL